MRAGDLVVPVYELQTAEIPDPTDGSLDDWQDIVPGASLRTEDFDSEGREGIRL